MEKRLIVAIVLSFLVLMGYQYFFVKPDKAPLKPAGPGRRGPLDSRAGDRRGDPGAA